MMKRMIIMLIVVGIVLGGFFGFQAFKGSMIKQFMAAGANPPQTVSTIKAEYTEWQPEMRAVGSLRAVNGAEISSEASGIVDEVLFNSGDNVDADTIILKIRAEDETAQLQSARAEARLAEINYQRDLKQLKAQTISQATLDASEANLAVARAKVAERDSQLEKKIIKAPFTGQLGIRQVDIGQFLTAGTNIVTLQQLDPIYVDFFVPQKHLQKIKLGLTVSAVTDAYANESFTGTITAINAKVESETRNILVRATIPNPDLKLRPGMYANVAIASGETEKYLTLPQTAITYNPYGNSVYLVKDNGQDDKGQPQLKAEQVFVTTGERRGDQVAILSGVQEGDTVITAGQVKLRPGSPVIINNDVQPSNDPAPAPKDG